MEINKSYFNSKTALATFVTFLVVLFFVFKHGQVTNNNTNIPQMKRTGRVVRTKTVILPLLNIEEHTCSKLLSVNKEKVNHNLKEYQEAIKDHDRLLASSSSKVSEGYAAKLVDEPNVQFYLATLPTVKTICETGFNGGHSTLLWLTANKQANVYSFDIGTHPYSKVAADILTKKFGSRLTVTWGDSKKTLPIFADQNPNINCDLIIIDGGHSYDIALADFYSFKRMASENHIVFLDDHPCKSTYCIGPGKMWNEQLKKKELVELASCSIDNKRRGFSFGQYLFWS